MPDPRAQLPAGTAGRMLTILAVAAAACGLAGCTSSHAAASGASLPSSSATTSAPAGAATTSTNPAPPTTRPAPPTTVWQPTSLQQSPDAAASSLIQAWSSGNRTTALSAATPAAVGALFGQPYPAGYIQARGCTDPGTNPGTCTYANRDSGSLYEIGVTHLPSGWYVSSVTVES